MSSDVSLASLALPCHEMPDAKNMRTVPADGSLKNFESFKDKRDLILIDKNGAVVGWIPFAKLAGVLLDRWKMAAAHYETLLESIDDAVTIVDDAGVYCRLEPGGGEPLSLF